MPDATPDLPRAASPDPSPRRRHRRHRADRAGRRRGRDLLVLSALALALVLATYVALVLTHAGQRWDDAALLGRYAHDASARDLARGTLDGIDRVTLVAMAAVLVVIGLARHRRWLALAAAGGMAVAVVGAELGKLVLPRPDLGVDAADGVAKVFDTYPSGHATIATSFALGLVLVSAPRWRPWVTVPALVWAMVVVESTVVAGWHRPSDALGGVLWATTCLAAAGGVLMSREGRHRRPGRDVWLLPAVLGAVLVVSVPTSWDALPALRGQDVESAFWLGQALVDVTVIVAGGAYAWLLRDVTAHRDR